MPRGGKGRTILSQLTAFCGAGSSVIYMLLTALNPALERGGIFPQVVDQPGKPPLVLCTKGSGKFAAQLRCSIQML